MLTGITESVLTIMPRGELTADTAVQFREQTMAALAVRDTDPCFTATVWPAVSEG